MTSAELLADAFGRVQETVHEAVGGLTTSQLAARLDGDANSVAWLCWLVLMIGWLADDSGVIVPAAALPFAVPLVVSIAVSVSVASDGGRYGGTAAVK